MIEGLVTDIKQRQVNTPSGVGIAYSIQIDNQWTSVGFKEPSCSAGDTVRFETVANGQYVNMTGALTIVEKGVLPAGAVQAGNTTTLSPPALERPNARALSIEYQSARKDALVVVGILLGAEAIPIKSTKISDKMDIILGYVDEITERFYNKQHDFSTDALQGDS